MTNLTKRIVDAAHPKEKDDLLWCGALKGFGVRIYPRGRKMFVTQMRADPSVTCSSPASKGSLSRAA